MVPREALPGVPSSIGKGSASPGGVSCARNASLECSSSSDGFILHRGTGWSCGRFPGVVEISLPTAGGWNELIFRVPSTQSILCFWDSAKLFCPSRMGESLGCQELELGPFSPSLEMKNVIGSNCRGWESIFTPCSLCLFHTPDRTNHWILGS